MKTSHLIPLCAVLLAASVAKALIASTQPRLRYISRLSVASRVGVEPRVSISLNAATTVLNAQSTAVQGVDDTE